MSERSQMDLDPVDTPFLSAAKLAEHVSAMVKDSDRAELILLELMKKYSFNFKRLEELVRGSGLKLSFSKVKYLDVAPMVGLHPDMQGRDLKKFPVFQARLTNSLFLKILDNVEDMGSQYGYMDMHNNEESRSRFLSSFFNKTIRLFGGAICNTPEMMLEGCLTTKGRIEYQFKVLGGVTVVFIEVKRGLGGLEERLDNYAQVIAESDACNWVNFQRGYRLPVLAVLCDGNSFYFFKFEGQPGKLALNSPISLGVFPGGPRKLHIPDFTEGDDRYTFIFQIRPVCECLYWLFLTGYYNGLDAYFNRSVDEGRRQGKGRDSTPMWGSARALAKEALDKATHAWNIKKEDLDLSEEIAEEAEKLLTESAKQVPHTGHMDLTTSLPVEILRNS